MKKLLFSTFLSFIAVLCSAQYRYCNTYEDFLENRWHELDTLYIDSHSKKQQLWWGGNDFTLTTGDKAFDNILKKDIFIVSHGDTLYVNCRNLRYHHGRFGNGYTRAVRIGQHSLLFVNKWIGDDAFNNSSMAILFGAVGAMAAANQQIKNQVCYIISSGANSKGRVNIRLVDDNLMEQMIAGANHYELTSDFYSVKDTEMRLLANHVIPILEKAGLLKEVY